MDYSRLQYTTDSGIVEYIIFLKWSMYNMELDNAGGALWSA